jgi:uncharacterized damage-inducible protein DinB
MESKGIIEEFERSWAFARQLTYDFVQAVPDAQWDYTPQAKYSPLSKQFRHMIWVTGLYRDALESKEMKPTSSKKTHYSGGLGREEILAGLKKQDQLLQQSLDSLKAAGLEGYSVKAFGAEMGFTEFTHIILHHESNHHGLWSMYASLGGFATPKSWADSWGL